MQYFGIQFTDYNVEVNDVEDAVEKDIFRSREASWLQSHA